MKRLKQIAILVIIIAVLFCLYTLTRPEPEEFEFCQNRTVYSDGYITTSLRIIVNVKDYNMEEMFEKIREKYIEKNGEPDELKIRLYKSRSDLLTPNYVGEKIYIKNAGQSRNIKRYFRTKK